MNRGRREVKRGPGGGKARETEKGRKIVRGGEWADGRGYAWLKGVTGGRGFTRWGRGVSNGRKHQGLPSLFQMMHKSSLRTY